MDRETEIARLERRQKDLTKKIGNLFGDENAAAHAEMKRIHRSLGRLYLERDKERRPEVYRP